MSKATYNINPKQFPTSYKFSSAEEKNIVSAHLQQKNNTFIYYLVTDVNYTFKHTTVVNDQAKEKYYWNINKHMIDRFDEISNWEFVIVDPEFIENQRNFMPAASVLGRRYMYCVDPSKFDKPNMIHVKTYKDKNIEGLRYFKTYEDMSTHITKYVHEKVFYICSEYAANAFRHLIDQIQIVVDPTVNVDKIFLDDKEVLITALHQEYSDISTKIDKHKKIELNPKHHSFDEITAHENELEQMLETALSIENQIDDIKHSSKVVEHEFNFDKWSSFLSFNNMKLQKMVVSEKSKTETTFQQQLLFADFKDTIDFEDAIVLDRANQETIYTFNIFTLTKPPIQRRAYRLPKRKGNMAVRYVKMNGTFVEYDVNNGNISSIILEEHLPIEKDKLVLAEQIHPQLNMTHSKSQELLPEMFNAIKTHGRFMLLDR